MQQNCSGCIYTISSLLSEVKRDLGTLCNVKSLIMQVQRRAPKSTGYAVSAAKLQNAETSQSSSRAVPVVAGQPPLHSLAPGVTLPPAQQSSAEARSPHCVWSVTTHNRAAISLLFSFAFGCSEGHRQP